MIGRPWQSGLLLGALGLGSLAFLAIGPGGAANPEPAPQPVPCSAVEPPAPLAGPTTAAGDQPYPITLPTALQLANVQPLDIAIAIQRLQAATAQLERANVCWLPTLLLGGDYNRHDGQIQNEEGKVFGVSKSTLLVGAGPTAVFALSDAIFAPLAARQERKAREADLQTAKNDTLLAVAVAYVNVQQARGELAGAEDVVRRTEALVSRAEKLVPALVPAVEVVRARTELARRRQTVHAARERWRLASAELVRILTLDPTVLVEPLEPPHLQVTLICPEQTIDELIPLALTHRPELASQQALVQATLQRLRQERLRPLVPSILLRGSSTSPGGTLAGGVFGGGTNDNLSKFTARSDFDIQVLWELQNLGFGNRARVHERQAENNQAALELFRLQDRIAAEVVQAHAQVASAVSRLQDAEAEVKDAVDSVQKNIEGLNQTRRAGDIVLLVIRPQEAVAAVQALGQAYIDYYGAVADYDRAQFRLYRALGQPAQALAADGPACPRAAAPDGATVPGLPSSQSR